MEVIHFRIRLTDIYELEEVSTIMRYTVRTDGLSCGHCEARVESALLDIPGVIDAEADHQTQMTEVECDDNVSFAQIRKAIEGAGYDVVSIESD